MTQKTKPFAIRNANGSSENDLTNQNEYVATKYYSYGTQQSPVSSPILRVSVEHPCPICGKHDWCGFTEDGNLAFCQRVSAGSIKTANNGASIHALQENTIERSASWPKPLANKSSSLAGADQRHVVYTALLKDCLILTSRHGSHLLEARGLNDTTIAAKLYASTVESIAYDFSKLELHPESKNAQDMVDAVKNLTARFSVSLKGVPGFFEENGVWKLRFVGKGIFIPIRDPHGRIRGLQVRLDENRKSRYIWLSTPPEKFNSGTKVKTFIHYAKPDLATKTGEAYLTEGALKADIISEFSDAACISIPGVTSVTPEMLISEMKQFLPELATIYVAFDMDWQQNSAVKNALFKTIDSLESAKYKVRIKSWDVCGGKGFDDFLQWLRKEDK